MWEIYDVGCRLTASYHLLVRRVDPDTGRLPPEQEAATQMRPATKPQTDGSPSKKLRWHCQRTMEGPPGRTETPAYDTTLLPLGESSWGPDEAGEPT